MNLRVGLGSVAVPAAPVGVSPTGRIRCTAMSVRRDAEHCGPEARAPHLLAGSWPRFTFGFGRCSFSMNLKVGRVTPCAPGRGHGRTARRGLTRPTGAERFMVPMRAKFGVGAFHEPTYSFGECGRPGCTGRRLADREDTMHRHECSAGRRTLRARGPRSPSPRRFMAPIHIRFREVFSPHELALSRGFWIAVASEA